MPHLRYEFARLQRDYYLNRVSERFQKKRKLPPPSYVLWDSTRRCNLGCLHCGATKETYTQELTTEQIQHVIDELADLKVRMFSVTGGEPLLRQDLLQVLAHARKRGLRTGIATNAYLLDRLMARRLQEVGVFSVQVSLDGLEQTHNTIRSNRYSYSRAITGLENLKAYHIPLISVATTITPGNISELYQIKSLLLQLGVRLWRLTPVMPIGKAQDAGLHLDHIHLVALFRFMQENDDRDLHIYLGENLTFLADWDRKIRRRPVFCPIGFTACCIGVDGHIRGCPEQPDTEENREGSILNSPFSDIWQDGFSRYRTREILAADPACTSCRLKLECMGGCWVMREEQQHCIVDLLSAI
jgi:radical SAM protein with 4Fe4S-binding SPASM domain